MKRKIIQIDEELCNGCGECVTACAEGALQIVDGKARLVKEQFCDGFGDCIGECPTGALTIEERECEDFDLDAVKTHVYGERGANGVQAVEDAHRRHEEAHTPKPPVGGCPGMRQRTNLQESRSAAPSGGSGPGQAIPSELNQWPIQLHLVQPGAPFFKNKELVVMSTCGPLASADTHWRFLRGRSVVVACPKLDRTEGYAEKLGAILSEPTIPKVIVVRMEVPCCGGLTAITEQAVGLSGRDNLEMEEVTIALDGNII